MSLSQKVRATLRQEGLRGLPLHAALYISRRLASRSVSWTRRLDFKIAASQIYRQYGDELKRNSAFAGKHARTRCFVLGNGPSLNQHDLRPLGRELTFASNAFFKHPIMKEWRPNYYFLTDPLYFDGSVASQQALSELISNVDAATYFVPHSVEHNHFAKVQCFSVGMAGDLADDLEWSPDLTKVVPGVRTVVQLGIIAAMYMGCSPIYLLGMDHDWLAHTGEHQNFYKGRSMQNEGTLDDWPYEDLMKAVLTMWRGYRSIRRVADSMGMSIVNISCGGFLDVFERRDYTSVVDLPASQINESGYEKAAQARE